MQMEGEDMEPLEDLLEYRKKLYGVGSPPKPNPLTQSTVQDDSWKWLLTTKQIEQRTDEWYSETKNLITASEIAAIWKGPRSRAALVMAKAPAAASPSAASAALADEPVFVPQRNLAVRRENTGPMDWGVRYEPVVKQILEDSLGAKIQDLGRIRHREVSRVAASPDGLFVQCDKEPALVGTLVEIKCPPSRVINDKIPFDYWCQMQLQMEVCGRPSCEFVEAKFRELAQDEKPSSPSAPAPASPSDSASAKGWIVLEGNSDTMETRYVYSSTEPFEGSGPSGPFGPWVFMEKYQWELVHMRRITVPKDTAWFQSIQPDLAAFWTDVEAARKGEWVPPSPRPSKKKKEAEEGRCAIVEED
jgi:putative phage-type endonuclease